MASIALGIAGAAIGSAFGNPMLGLSLGLTLGGVLFPQSAGSRGKLDDLRVTGSAYGTRLPKFYGEGRGGGNVIWSTDLKEHKQQDGGKGGGGVTQYTYSVTCAVAIGEGPITSVDRIWADDVILYQNGAPAKGVVVTIYLGDETQNPDPTMEAIVGVGNTPAYRGTAYVVFEDLPLADYGNRIPNFSYEVNGGPATVASILSDMASQCGLDASETLFDYAGAAVPGMVIADRASAKSLLEPLLKVYQVDLSERDGLLVAVPRGGAVDLDIDANDLCPLSKEQGGANHRSITRTQELELPVKLDLSYLADSSRHFEMVSQSASRHTKALSVQDTITETVPLVLSDNTAHQAATTLLYQRWLERTTHMLALLPKYLAMAPATVANLPVNGVNQRVRIVSIDIALFGALQVRAVPDRVQVLTQGTSGATTAGPTRSVAACAPVAFDAWSNPQIRPADGDSPGFYVVAAGAGSVYYSTNGTDWLFAGNVTTAGIFGTTTSALANGSAADAFDHTNTVNVNVNGTLTSTSEADVENTTDNSALIGTEIAGYATATAIDATDFTLSDILRGRNTSSMVGHTSGERFVRLDPAAVVRVSVPAALVGTTLQVKVISGCQALGDVTAKNVTIIANTTPYVTPGDLAAATALDAEFWPVTNGDAANPSILFHDGEILYFEA